jgi:hypothetical protein
MDESTENRRPEPGVAVVDEQPPPAVEGAGPVTVPEADVFRFDRVDRAGGRLHGPRTRRGLSLDFDDRGIEVFGPKTGRRQTIRWSDVAWASVGPAAVDADGRTETPIDVESTDGLVRYLVKSEGPLAVTMAALEIQLARWTGPGRSAPIPEAVADSVSTAAPAPPASGPAPPTMLPPVGAVRYPPPAFPPEYAQPSRYAFDTTGPTGTWPLEGEDATTGGRKRTRRTVTLVVALVLLVSGVGLAVGLSVTGTTTTTGVATAPSPNPAKTSDERLAQQLLLTRGDLPAGWRASTDPGADANSPALQQGEARITKSLARCMGITDAEGAIVLGGQAPDQTAQTSSPIFVAPTSATAGTAVELQTAATVVRSHSDEAQDFDLFDNPKYPQCAATASAEELQLGVNQTSGGDSQAGPATVSPLDLPATSGVQQSGLLMAFSVVDGTATVPVQVESITLGAHRVEAGLEVFAIGGQIPDQALSASISTFERRVASDGASSVV